MSLLPNFPHCRLSSFVLLAIIGHAVGTALADDGADAPSTTRFVSEEPASPSDRAVPREGGQSDEAPWLSEDDVIPPPMLRSRAVPLFGQFAYAGDGNRWSPSYNRLASIPNIFGHFYASGMTFIGFDGLLATTDVPMAGRTQVAENNKALTQDRVYIRYNHYSQAFTADASQFIVGPDRRVFDLDTYTIGAEVSFLDRLWSLEARMPFMGRTDFSTPNFSVNGGDVGNLALALKRMLYQSEYLSVAAGLGIDLPTGSSVNGHVNLTEFVIHNDAVHLLPFAGFAYAPDSPYFLQGFAQLDVPLNGQRISTNDLLFGPWEPGVFTEQTLLHLDLSAGRWLLRNPDARLLTGLACVTELHYTTTLNDSDTIVDFGFPMTLLAFTNPANRVDILDFTVGLHAELRQNTLVRVGGVFPLRTGSDRTFDAELQVQLERRF